MAAGIEAGTIYLIPGERGLIVSQVAAGLDLAVFEGSWQRDSDFSNLGTPIFRVHFSFNAPKRFKWIKIGKQELHGDLARVATYGFREIGGGKCFKVADGKPDQEVPCSNIEGLEPLATWDHPHIVRRFYDRSYQG